MMIDHKMTPTTVNNNKNKNNSTPNPNSVDKECIDSITRPCRYHPRVSLPCRNESF